MAHCATCSSTWKCVVDLSMNSMGKILYSINVNIILANSLCVCVCNVCIIKFIIWQCGVYILYIRSLSRQTAYFLYSWWNWCYFHKQAVVHCCWYSVAGLLFFFIIIFFLIYVWTRVTEFKKKKYLFVSVFFLNTIFSCSYCRPPNDELAISFWGLIF